MNKPVIVGSIIVALLVGAVSGYAVGKTGNGPVTGASEQEKKQAFDAGYEKAKNDINDTFVAKGMSYPLDYQITDVFGKVVEVGSGGFVIEYDTAQFTVLDKGFERKTVTLASGVKVQKMVDAPKGSATDAAANAAPRGSLGVLEVKESEAAPDANGKKTPSLPPNLPATDAQMALDITLGDLKVGDYVHVKTDGNAKKDGSLQATEVTVLNVTGSTPDEKPKFSDLPFSRTYGKAAP